MFSGYWSAVCEKGQMQDSILICDSSGLDSLKMISHTYQHEPNTGFDKIQDALNIQSILRIEDVGSGRKSISTTSDKVSFLLSGLLPDHEAKIQNILCSNAFTECHVFTGISEEGLVQMGKCEEGYFANFQATLKDWLRMGQAEADAKKASSKKLKIAKSSVQYAPIISPLSENLFFVPYASTLFPLLSFDEQTSFDDLPSDSQKQAEILSQTIIDVLSHLNFHSSFFAMGKTSEIIGKKIMELYQQPSEPESHASVIIIDRTLDLVSPCLHSDNLFDQLYSFFPRKAPFSIDLGLRLDPLFPPDFNLSQVMPDITGSLALTGNGEAAQEAYKMRNFLINDNSKGTLNSLKKMIIEIAAKEKLQVKAPKGIGKVTANNIIEMLESFPVNSAPFFRHLSFLQYVVAILEGFQLKTKYRWDEISGIEKVLLMSSSEDQSFLEQLTELAEKDEKNQFGPKEIVILSVLCYSLFGDSLEEEGDNASLLYSFYQAIKKLISKSEGNENSISISAEEKGNHIVERLNLIKKARSSLRHYNSLLNQEDEEPEAGFKGLIEKILLDIYQQNEAASADLVHIQSTQNQSGFFKGFSQYLTKGKMRISVDDDSFIVLFVVGGITFHEIHALNSLAAQHNSKIIIGSTNILTPDDVYTRVFL